MKRGPRRHATIACVYRSYRGLRTGRRDMRVAREPERPCRFHRQFPARDPEYQLPGAHGRTSRPLGANRTQRWYRQAKATKRGETGGRESERLIVPTRRGNWTDGPRGGKGAPFQGTVGGNHGGCSETRVRVTATTTDSKDGCEAAFTVAQRILESRSRVR